MAGDGVSARLLVGGWALLLVAWTLGNPPFAAPDEGDHYVRAVALSSGQLLGNPTRASPPGVTPAQRAWTRQAIRAVSIPGGLSVPADCYPRDVHRSAGCTDAVTVPAGQTTAITAVGTYQPLPYVLPGAVLRAADTPGAALRWARAAGALAALLLLASAVAVLRDPAGDPRVLLGPLTAVTPMTLYCAASLTGSGLEIVAAVAVTCAVLRLTRAAPASRWAWALLGIAGAVLALSRSASPLWLALLLILGPGLLGLRAAFSRVRHGGRPAVLALFALGAAIAANRAWEAAYGPHVVLATRAVRLGVINGSHQWARAARELVGGFGYLDYVLPIWLPLVWLCAVAAVAVLAWRGSRQRERRILLGAGAVAALLPLIFYVVFIRATGFGLQGRHVLPLVAALPQLARRCEAGSTA